MIVKVQRVGNIEVPLPQYQTEGSAGFDLHAAIEAPITIHPYPDRNWKLIPTGLIFEIPPGFEGQIRPRSGLALKHAISVLNSPGTIDSDFRGTVGVIIINHGLVEFIINPLDRIAQMIISPVIQVGFEWSTKLTDTERGDGGFGSTKI